MRSRDWNRILAGLLIAPVPFVVHAETYLNELQAAKVLFPDVRLEPRWMDLTPAEAKSIQKAAGVRVSDPHVRIYWGPSKEAVVIDRVIGKHDYITYAVGITPDGKVQGIEILDYRETYGSQVREPSWRKQFVGKTATDPLNIDKDIQNISGATLSSAHITNGVRRVLQTYEILKKKA
jgi:Na+-translocating ferredoxin:NAD+ oxidoreductase RnfG subunit